MATEHPRMKRERITIEKMIRLYCRAHHQTDDLCQDCQNLLAYAWLRLQHCPFQENKTTCGNCAIHCYKRTMRDKVRTVMGWAGPRMIRYHPILAIGHLIDGFRKQAAQPEKKS